MKKDKKVVVLNILLLAIVIFLAILVVTSSPTFSGNALKDIFGFRSEKTVKEVRIIQEPKPIPIGPVDPDPGIPAGMDEKSFARFSGSSSPPGTTDYFGSVSVDGYPALQGTVVYAMAPDNGEGQPFECGRFVVNHNDPGIGFYGVLHCSCGGENPECDGQGIYFEVEPPNMERKEASKEGNSEWDESFKQVNIHINTRCSEYLNFEECDVNNKPLYCEEIELNSFEAVANCERCGCPPSYWDYKNNRMVYWCCNRDHGGCYKQYSPCSNVGGT